MTPYHFLQALLTQGIVFDSDMIQEIDMESGHNEEPGEY